MKLFGLLLCFLNLYVNAEGNKAMLEESVGHEFLASGYAAQSPRQRLHLVLLGVADVTKSTAFYEALGWKKIHYQQ